MFASVFQELSEIQTQLDKVKGKISQHTLSERDNPDGVILAFINLKMDKLLNIDLG